MSHAQLVAVHGPLPKVARFQQIWNQRACVTEYTKAQAHDLSHQWHHNAQLDHAQTNKRAINAWQP